jgi:hypothetical protein
MDPELLARLQSWASEDLRSLNGHIEFLLRQALQREGRLGPEKATNKDPE